MTNKGPNREMKRLLEQYLDGELTPSQSEQVKAQLAESEELQQAFDELQKLRVLVREVYLEESRTADLDDVLPGVLKKVEEQPAGFKARLDDWLDKYRLRLASPLAPIGVAATLVVAVVAGGLIYLSSTPESGNSVDRPKVAEQVEAVQDSSSGTGLTGQQMEQVAAQSRSELPRRPAHEERPFHKNEAYIVDYEVESGIVVIDVDPEGDAPAVVWHFPEDSGSAIDEEDNRI